jgi:hypothetical protein
MAKAKNSRRPAQLNLLNQEKPMTPRLPTDAWSAVVDLVAQMFRRHARVTLAAHVLGEPKHVADALMKQPLVLPSGEDRHE